MSFTFSPVFIFLLAENSFRERVTALCKKTRRRQKRENLDSRHQGRVAESNQAQISVWAAHLRLWKSTSVCWNINLCYSTIIRWKQLTLTPQQCVCVSGWATGHHPHPAPPPSFSFLPSRWSQNWEKEREREREDGERWDTVTACWAAVAQIITWIEEDVKFTLERLIKR